MSIWLLLTGSCGGNTFVFSMDHEDNYKESLINNTFESGVTYLFEDWALSIDQKAKDMEAEHLASVATLRTAAGEESGYAKLTAIAEGVTISHHDNVNKELSDYFQAYEKASVVDGTISYFLYECGFDDVKELREGWGPDGYATKKTGAICVNHNTDTDYTIVGFHSFKDKSDYYLVKTKTITKPYPNSLFIAADSGTRIADELRGGDTLSCCYGIIAGGNRGFTPRVYTKGTGAENNILRSYIPSKTANRNTTMQDSTTFSIGGGVSVQVMIGSTQMGSSSNPLKDITRLKFDTCDGEDIEADFYDPPVRSVLIGGLGIGASFNVGLTHSTSRTWEVSDYTITPAVYYECNRRVAAWNLNVDWPEYQSDCYWKMADAFHDNVMLETKSMWQIPAANRDTVSFYGQTDSIIGFCWAHKMPSQSASQYHIGVRHAGAEIKLTLPQPPLIGIDSAIQSGGKEGKTYTAKLYCEEAWSAASNADWLTIPTAQGEACSGEEFNFTVEPNDTGKDRVGYITVKPSSGKPEMIRFTQLAYDK